MEGTVVETKKITRVEIIDKQKGRIFTDTSVDKLEISIQDGGRTLKLFIE